MKALDSELFDTPVPVNNEDSLHLWFYLPPMPSDQASNLLSIPSYLIGHEGEGSILNLLKKEGLATELLIGSFLGTKLKLGCVREIILVFEFSIEMRRHPTQVSC